MAQEEKSMQVVVPKETLDFFNRDELRARVFYEKYTLRDYDGNVLETVPPEMWARLAKELSGVEVSQAKRDEWKEKFYWMLSDFKFVPGGRIIFGAGQEGRKVTLLNCYVCPVKGDTIEDIFQWCKEAAKTYSYSGGVGTDISVLRPKDSPVHNSAMKSTGAVSFMNIMSETTGIIGQAGRRGALMITMSVDHPDVEEFINVKKNLKKVRYANISLRITDEFMRAVESDSDFTLKFESERTGKIERKVRAKDLWNQIVNSARDWAEPGLIFWDTVTRYSPSEYNGMNVISTNPCVTAETPVLTPDGWARVDSLRVGDSIITAYGTSKPISEIYVHEDHDIYKVGFTDGSEVNATKGHIFHTREGRADKDRYWNKFWNTDKRLSELKVGDMVRVPRINSVPNNPVDTHGIPYREYGFMIGTLLGDGCYTEKVVARGHAKIASDIREREWNNKVMETFRHVSENISIHPSGKDNGCYIMLQKAGTQFVMQQTILKPAMSFQKEIPIEYINSNSELHMGMIDGLVSTDGNINMDRSNPALRVSSTSKKLLEGARSILFFYGIHAKIYTTKRRDGGMIGDRAVIGRHESYALYVYGADLAKFASIFRISHPGKQDRLDKLKDMSVGTSSDFSKIKSVEYLGKATVYDIFEKETDTWITNGYVSRGCSEQPLQAYGACDLGHVNLNKFVLNPFADNASVDWAGFEKTVRFGVRFLDNVLLYNDLKHPLKEQSQACRDSRRIGLGITGLADMLAMLKIKYDTEEGLAFVDKLMDRLKSVSYDESIEIAKEKGSFEKFDTQKHLSMPFVKTLSPELQEKIGKYGLRNVAILTIAPTGSISVLAGTSSGIEPVFAFSYTRRSESLSQEYFKVYHPLVADYMAAKHISDEKDLPEFFVPAHKINADFRVRMQGTIQKHVDSAISSTVNLPETVGVDEVSKIYFQAWKAGCKGITVYREGSREGILITDEKAKENEAKKAGVAVKADWKRPKAVIGQTVKLRMPTTSVYVTVNTDGDNVKEVFINVGKSGTEDKSYSEAIGRIISIYLQNGGDIDSVIKSLKGIRGSSMGWDNGVKLLSVPDAIAKALEIVVDRNQQTTLTAPPEGQAQQSVAPKSDHGHKKDDGPIGIEACPECESESLVNESGCIYCKSCGYSKCS